MLCQLVATATALRVKRCQLVAPAALLTEALGPATPVQCHIGTLSIMPVRHIQFKFSTNMQIFIHMEDAHG